MDYEGHRFENETVTLDGHTFTDCTFHDTVMEYSGGTFSMHGKTQFTGDWRVRFLDASRGTATLMLALINGMGVTFKDRFDVEAPGHLYFN